MSSSSEEAVSGPTRALQDCYLNSLQARHSYLNVVTGGASDAQTREAAHAELHSTTMQWFEALQPYLEEYDDLEHFWAEVELWPTDYETKPVAFCHKCESGWEETDDTQPGFTCPGCGDGVLQREEVLETNKSGDPQYTYATGLKTLNQYEGRTRTVTETVNMTCRQRTVERTVPVRLKPKRLLRACHELDKAGDRLDLLADVAKNIPKTEITKETIDAFKDRIQQVVKEAKEGIEETSGVDGQ